MTSKQEQKLFAVFRFRVGLSLLLATGFYSSATAQQAHTTADGIYTAAQAARGKTLYFNDCIACHGGELQGEEDNPSLTGQPFMSKWGGQPVSMLLDFINRTMPPGNGGVLGATGDADVVAFILSYNGFPAGRSELPTNMDVLRAITINKSSQPK
jgi:quinoprotein glucose dehydrogenase